MYKSIHELKKQYQPKVHFIKDENSDMFVDSHSTVDRRKNHFSKLLNIHAVGKFRGWKTYCQTILP
jgi:hypothetical protein